MIRKRFEVLLPRLQVLGMLLAGSWLSVSILGSAGCQKETLIANTPATTIAGSPESNQSTSGQEQQAESAETNPKGVLDAAADLLGKAKSSGGNAGNWVKDRLGEAANAGGSTAQETLDWANQTYQSLKQQGLTTASSTSEWVSEDWNKMGAWEYKVIQLGSEPERVEKTLNELGLERWECFHIAAAEGSGQTFYFKKPARSYLKNIPFKDMIRLVPLLDDGQ